MPDIPKGFDTSSCSETTLPIGSAVTGRGLSPIPKHVTRAVVRRIQPARRPIITRHSLPPQQSIARPPPSQHRATLASRVPRPNQSPAPRSRSVSGFRPLRATAALTQSSGHAAPSRRRRASRRRSATADSPASCRLQVLQGLPVFRPRHAITYVVTGLTSPLHRCGLPGLTSYIRAYSLEGATRCGLLSGLV
ncbi:hypothetical protein PVAP13_4KG127605 [Panicum virgatum]|uniref:Uncharacterized protein n=1 Tax=Panicum virgatum TaxID=38727 RepID=A0A8T0TRA3_PANVG|nr:hypothetical protein PVAP13_4KG127605 [Panicum virgatum]